MEKGQLFRTANLYRRGRGVMTSISEKLVSFWANVSWKFEKCDTALREVSRNTKSAQRLCAALTGRAAALPVIFPAHQSQRPHSRPPERPIFAPSNYMIFSAPGRAKLHLRRFETSQMCFHSCPM